MLILKELPKAQSELINVEINNFPTTYDSKENRYYVRGFNSCLSLIKTKEVSVSDLEKVLLEYEFKYYDEEGHNLEEVAKLEDFTTKSYIKDLAIALIKYMEGL
jgi:hypothetical protein